MSRPPLVTAPANVSKEQTRQANESERIRNSIEGKFGQGKIIFSVNIIMANSSRTYETAISITFENDTEFWRCISAG
ncbi:transposase [Richelia intracellularis]|nr:transposase [Richelia intracellularis]